MTLLNGVGSRDSSAGITTNKGTFTHSDIGHTENCRTIFFAWWLMSSRMKAKTTTTTTWCDMNRTQVVRLMSMCVNGPLLGGRPGFNSWQGQVIFLRPTASRPALRPTQPPNKWVPGSVSAGVKRPEDEADHSPPSSAEAKNSYTSTPPSIFMA
jgi:hypothetical protein